MKYKNVCFIGGNLFYSNFEVEMLSFYKFFEKEEYTKIKPIIAKVDKAITKRITYQQIKNYKDCLKLYSSKAHAWIHIFAASNYSCS